MTDVLAALAVLSAIDCPERRAALDAFHARWHGDDLVLDKWFAIQAMSPLPDTPDAVRALAKHADFDLRNPNRVRALVASFASGNQVRFHDPSGSGYRLPGRHHHRTGSDEQPGCRASGAAAWPVAPRRAGAPGADEAGAAADPRRAEPQQGHIRDGDAQHRLSAGGRSNQFAAQTGLTCLSAGRARRTARRRDRRTCARSPHHRRGRMHRDARAPAATCLSPARAVRRARPRGEAARQRRARRRLLRLFRQTPRSTPPACPMTAPLRRSRRTAAQAATARSEMRRADRTCRLHPRRRGTATPSSRRRCRAVPSIAERGTRQPSNCRPQWRDGASARYSGCFVDRQARRVARHQKRAVALAAVLDRRHREHDEHFGERPVGHPGLLAEDAVPVCHLPRLAWSAVWDARRRGARRSPPTRGATARRHAVPQCQSPR